MKYIIKKYFTISIVLTTIALILVNCKRDDLNLQENSSVRDLSYTTKTVKASEIPTIMNFITNRVSKDLKIQIDDSSRNDIIHTKSSEEDITVGEIIVNNIKTVTNSSQKTNYSFKIAKEIPSAPYFFNLIVKESNNGTYAYIVKYEYADSNWVFNGNNLDTFIGKKVFYSPTGKYLAKFDISNGVISNKTFGFPCSDFDGIGSNSGGGGTSYPIDDIGNGTPIYNPTIPSNDSGQGNDSSDSGDSSSAGSSNSSGGNSSDGGSSTEMGVLGSCDQLYVNYDMFEDSDGNPIPITVDCHNVPVVSKSTRLGRLLKSGGIDSNGDCIPDIDDDGYEEPIDNDDENDLEPINIGKAPDPETSCEDLNNIYQRPNRLRIQLNQLKYDDGNYEKGIQIRRNPLTNTNMPRSTNLIGSSGSSTHYVKIPMDRWTVAIAHNHPNEYDFAFYSGADILNLAKIAMTYNPNNTGNVNDPIIFTAYLVTDGETYAIKFDDAQSITNLISIYNQGKRARETFHERLMKSYHKDVNLVLQQTTDIFKQQQRFFKFLEDNNLNISAYKATYDSSGFINGWNKINKETLTLEPCN